MLDNLSKTKSILVIVVIFFFSLLINISVQNKIKVKSKTNNEIDFNHLYLLESNIDENIIRKCKNKSYSINKGDIKSLLQKVNKDGNYIIDSKDKFLTKLTKTNRYISSIKIY